MRAYVVAAVTAIGLAGCMAPVRQVGPAPGPVAQAVPAGPKRIAANGSGGFVLPDGTQVVAESDGGFFLPNGDRVTADGAGGVRLPNGTRCGPDGAGGYLCP